MASSRGVVFESMADFLANHVDIRFASMLPKSTAPDACLVNESVAATAFQQVESDLLMETHPSTPSDLIADTIVLRAFSIASKYAKASSAQAGPLHLHPA
jgi:hypothetical protein